jgi:hypothetical protein
LTTPFRYDPTAGNLLLDIRNLLGRDPSNNPVLDATLDASNGVSRVFTGLGGTANDPTGDVESLGLVTEFTFAPVPEPSTWMLLVTGASALLIFRRRGQFRRCHHGLD